MNKNIINFNKKDYEISIKSEMEVLPILQKFFNVDTIIRIDEVYSIFDYKGDNKYIELKTRFNSYNKYPTTMIGLNKFEYASINKEDIYFVFKYIDGIYYYKYDKNDKFEIKNGGRCDRGRFEYKQYVFIPIEKLSKII